MPNLKGTKTDRITIRLPESTISELEELAEKSGLYRATFFGGALVAGARHLAQFFEKDYLRASQEDPTHEVQEGSQEQEIRSSEQSEGKEKGQVDPASK